MFFPYVRRRVMIHGTDGQPKGVAKIVFYWVRRRDGTDDGRTTHGGSYVGRNKKGKDTNLVLIPHFLSIS